MRMAASARRRWLGVVALLVPLIVGGCHTREWQGREAEKGVASLDTPFHFVLHLEGYRVDRLSIESDIFSSWGYLTLHQRAGWRTADPGTVDVDEQRLAKLGVNVGDKPLELGQAERAKPGRSPTRYACGVWFLDEGKKIVVSYRVDGN